MKARAILVLALVLLFFVSGVGAKAKGTGNSTSDIFSSSKIRILFHQQEIIVEMYDNLASRDFLSLLPLTLEFSDYAELEKVAYLPRRLITNSTATSHDAMGEISPTTRLGAIWRCSTKDLAATISCMF